MPANQVPPLAGRLIIALRDVTVVVMGLPGVPVGPDPYDNHVLAMASADGGIFL